MRRMTDTPPKVAVACAWYNRADYIRDTLDSLLAQDLDDFEIVMVNDGSPDPRVREILDSYDDPRLRVIHQPNSGFTLAIRRAIEASSAPFIALQGAGDVSHPARLRLQWEALQVNPEAAIAGCHYETVDMTSGQRTSVIPKTPKQGDIGFTGLSHGELMYRRATYNEVGGYRPIFTVGQGADLWMRILRKNTALTVPNPLYEQRYFPDGVATSSEKVLIRHIMNTIRVENEYHFRKTGQDLINSLGPLSFSALANKKRVRRAIIEANYRFRQNPNLPKIPLEGSLWAEAQWRMLYWRIRRRLQMF
jgi:glycosyltransferase involved in cell wall biosynthesis